MDAPCREALRQEYPSCKGRVDFYAATARVSSAATVPRLAFYTFVNQEHAAILADLGRIEFIHENTDANLFEFWSPDVHYLEPQNAFLRNLVAEADKLLEAKEKGYFSVLVNSDIVVCILYTTQLLVEENVI